MANKLRDIFSDDDFNVNCKLKFENNAVDETCDAIYHDAFIIELEKNKYDKNLTVEETVLEVKNEED